MTTFPQGEQILQLPGDVGELEAIVTTPTQLASSRVTAIICHPHPQQQGTMHNKVVTTLHRTCRDLGIRTVRFNFRGVGKSVGQFADGIGEIDDAIAVVNWVKQQRPHDNIWLLGFSFGACIALAATTRLVDQINYLICVAPGVDRPYCQAGSPQQCPWLVVQGGQDEVINAHAVTQWVNAIDTNPPQYCYFADVGHFFHGQLLLLRDCVTNALKNHLLTME